MNRLLAEEAPFADEQWGEFENDQLLLLEKDYRQLHFIVDTGDINARKPGTDAALFVWKLAGRNRVGLIHLSVAHT